MQALCASLRLLFLGNFKKLLQKKHNSNIIKKDIEIHTFMVIKNGKGKISKRNYGDGRGFCPMVHRCCP